MKKATEWEARANACRVLDYFEKFPDMHKQSSWFAVDGTFTANYYAESVEVDPDANVCNTSMCAAGTVMWLNEGAKGLTYFDGAGVDDVEAGIKRARKYLGLNEAQANALFVETTDAEAKAILTRIADGKKDIFKPYPHLKDAVENYEA